ncbi:LOW QUALITY PROTEIN: RIMS-binding protein 2 [Pristis pectinata]|uniref:LOW QUALITY PROTEIN: RIMS-binding protein 2 n=1 Tax=Pristis pectinata TaxID=685728 RepID=UPI00223CEBE9|nr:LOW QUALITY PROTEIN: RIMS-binding protein 2 [Pristis pectinata]
MREAAVRSQRLELEYVEALGILSTKQQEIRVLQKAQIEVKREHEGAVQLLEAKVRELEKQCQAQSEQFHLLSQELQRFRQSAGNIDLLNKPGSPWDSKPLTQLKNGVSSPLPKGHEIPSAHQPVICEYIRPLPMSGVKPELLSVRPTLLPLCTASSTGQDQLSEQMDIELDGDNPKMKYTGRVRLCVARYSYNPYKGPNEHPEAELPLKAGKYLYVYGEMDEDGFYEGELMDGRRGLVPSNFVALLQDEDLLLQSVDTEMDNNLLNADVNHMDLHLHGDHVLQDSKADGLLLSQPEPSVYNSSGMLDVNIDEIGEDVVPYPRRISLIKQLGRTVIVGWDPAAVPPGWGTVHSYNILVDKEVRSNIPSGGRTKALIEKLNLANFTYRISVQSVTDRGTSDELRCTLLVGKDVCVAPTHLKVDNISQTTAEISWQPSNSNYSHTIFLNGEEFDVVKAASYKYQFFNLKPCMTCKVKAVALPHQVPWQLPLEQREHREGIVEFCTLPTGPPAPPQDVTVQIGSTPGTLQISWKPPVLSSMGTSNGARVTGYSVCAKGQKVAEVKLATAESVTVDYLRIQNLETREIIVRTVSAQGESEDSCAAAIPTDLLGLQASQPWSPARTKTSASARAPDTKDQPLGPTPQREEPWEQAHSPPLLHGRSLEPLCPTTPTGAATTRSPSPQRILPQPQGAPISNTMAKAMAREAAQRVTDSSKAEKRSIFSQRSSSFQQENSDEEEDGYDAQSIKRPSASVDDFLRRSELGRQQHYDHGDSYHSESSRGSDLSDIMEEDEEELYSEMQLDEGGRRRHSATSHTALKISCQSKSVGEAQREHPEATPQMLHTNKLCSIPEEAGDPGGWQLSPPLDDSHLWASSTDPGRSGPEGRRRDHMTCGCPVWSPAGQERGPRAKSASGSTHPPWEDVAGSEWTRSPDGRLDNGSRREAVAVPPHHHRDPGTSRHGHQIRRRGSLQRQVSVEEDSFSEEASDGRCTSVSDHAHRDVSQHRAGSALREGEHRVPGQEQSGRTTKLQTSNTSVPNAVTVCVHRDKERSLMLGNSSGSGRTSDRMDHAGRRASHGSTGQRVRPMTVPSIEITVDSNSEGRRSRSGSEGPVSPSREDAHYRRLTGRRKWPHQRSTAPENRHDRYCGRGRLSPDLYEEAEPKLCTEDLPTRVFVALFDYDPLSMSPNPDAAEEELPFKEGQIIQVHGTKDADGFYHGETGGRVGLIPCNMVSEIQADSKEMVEQLVTQGFLPLNTPVEKIANPERYKESTRSVNRRSRKSKRERNRSSRRPLPVISRRMVALYDYDPRESSPNVDMEVGTDFCFPASRHTPSCKGKLSELTFCAGDIISVWGELDEDGFYYGEINGQRGLVPSNFLEEVPDDVEVYPLRCPRPDTLRRHPCRAKEKGNFPLSECVTSPSYQPESAGSTCLLAVTPAHSFSPSVLRDVPVRFNQCSPRLSSVL